MPQRKKISQLQTNGRRMAILFICCQYATDAFQTPQRLPLRTQRKTARWNIGLPRRQRHLSELTFQNSIPVVPAPDNDQRVPVAALRSSLWNKPTPTATPTPRRVFRSLLSNLKRKRLYKNLAQFVLTLCLAWSMRISSSWAVSGGRLGGGSFHCSPSRSSSSRPSMGYRTGRTSTLPYRPLTRPPRYRVNHHHYGYRSPHPSIIVSKPLRTRDIAVITGSGVLLAYVWKNAADGSTFEPESALGTGTTVSSITLALDVPNRNDPRNILNRLSSIAETANTISKRGLQDLLSSVALELLRQEKSITSAYTHTSHHKFVGQAEREFQSLSVHGRSKVDRLTGTYRPLPCFSPCIFSVNKFGSKDAPDEDGRGLNGDGMVSPTTGIVTLLFAIQGDSTILPQTYTREALRKALTMISTDAMVADCLLTAEILWSPNDPTEQLEAETVYADYPNLIPI